MLSCSIGYPNAEKMLSSYTLCIAPRSPKNVTVFEDTHSMHTDKLPTKSGAGKAVSIYTVFAVQRSSNIVTAQLNRGEPPADC